MIKFDLLSKNRHTRLIIRCRDVRDQSPFEAGTKSCLQCFNILRRFITGDDNLFSGCVQVIKRMKEFFLSTLFADDKLNIVDQEHVVIAVFIAEMCHSGFVIRGFTLFQSLDQLIGESLACYI